MVTTTHLWYDGHSTGISACGVWRVRTEIQVFMREFHTHIHLDYESYDRIEFSSCKKYIYLLLVFYLNPQFKLFCYSLIITNNNLSLMIYCENIIDIKFLSLYLFIIWNVKNVKKMSTSYITKLLSITWRFNLYASI